MHLGLILTLGVRQACGKPSPIGLWKGRHHAAYGKLLPNARDAYESGHLHIGLTNIEARHACGKPSPVGLRKAAPVYLTLCLGIPKPERTKCQSSLRTAALRPSPRRLVLCTEASTLLNHPEPGNGNWTGSVHDLCCLFPRAKGFNYYFCF